MQFEVIELDAKTQRVVLGGRLDSRAVDGLEAKFSAAVSAAGQRSVIDLTQLEFIASMGLRMLVSSARAAAGKGASFVLFGATGPVSEILEYASLSQIIPIGNDETEALALLNV